MLPITNVRADTALNRTGQVQSTVAGTIEAAREGSKRIMFMRPSRPLLALCACLLAACASTPTPVARQQGPGYWSQVEDFGTNPPPPNYETGDEATFYPYLQVPGAYDGYAGFSGWGGYGYYGGITGFDTPYGPYGVAPGFRSFYYSDPFYYNDPFYMDRYYYRRPIVVPAPGVTPMPTPRPKPPPASKPPVSKPAPHPVKPRPAPPPKPMPPPRARPDRGEQPAKP